MATTVKDPRIISWQYDPDAVHYTSSFTLTFRLSFPGQKDTRVKLSLQPNHDLLQDAKIEYIDSNGAIIRSEAIFRHEHKIYKGEAYIRDETTKQWRHCGWTRITVLQDGSHPLFEGAFLNYDDIYHIKLLSKYNARKDLDDADIGTENEDDIMVVYRDSDRFFTQASLIQRSIEGVVSSAEANRSMCAHDRLEFNIQQRERRKSAFGVDLLNRLTRRQGGDISGNIGGTTRADLQATIGDTAGCPQTRQVALVAAAADCSYVTANGNASATRSNIISIYNQAYPSLNVSDFRLLLFTNSN